MPKKPFVDFRDIRFRITMEQVLEHYGVLHTFKRTGDRLSEPCRIHKGSNPTQFRVETEKSEDSVHVGLPTRQSSWRSNAAVRRYP